MNNFDSDIFQHHKYIFIMKIRTNEDQNIFIKIYTKKRIIMYNF